MLSHTSTASRIRVIEITFPLLLLAPKESSSYRVAGQELK